MLSIPSRVMADDIIPVVDLKNLLSQDDSSACPEVEKLDSAFNSAGCIFIKNHGIDLELVNFEWG